MSAPFVTSRRIVRRGRGCRAGRAAGGASGAATCNEASPSRGASPSGVTLAGFGRRIAKGGCEDSDRGRADERCASPAYAGRNEPSSIALLVRLEAAGNVRNRIPLEVER